MRRLIVSAAATLVAVIGLVCADSATNVEAAELTSGLQVGDKAGAFNVLDCTGPRTGKKLCYRWVYGARPVVLIFTRELSDNLASLVKKIDDTVGENADQKMAAFVVLLSDDPDADESKLKDLAKKAGIKKTPLTLFDGISGPKNYKVAKDAEVTVMLWRKKNVKANHAFSKGALDAKGIKAVVADTAKILK